MSISEIIFKYLQTNRRITVPALGTFLSKSVKCDEEQATDDASITILFSEFLKEDDDILRGLLTEQMAMSELEAAIYLDRFVFDIRHAMEAGESFPLPYLGYMSSLDGKTFVFDLDTSVREPESESHAVEPQSQDVEVAEIVEIAEVEPQSPAQVESQDESGESDEAKPLDSTPEETQSNPILSLYETEVEDQSEQLVDGIFGKSEQSESGEKSGKRGLKFDMWVLVAIFTIIVAILIVGYGVYVQWLYGDVTFGDEIDSILDRLFNSRLFNFLRK